MSVQTVDSIEQLFDGEIDVNQPIDWEFLGADVGCELYDRWSGYRAGSCVVLPNGETRCAKRAVSPGSAGPGEAGWKHEWQRVSPVALRGSWRNTAERRHGRDGVSVGADYAAEANYAERHHGRGGVSVGADHAAEAAYAARHHGRGGVLVGALVADFQAIREAARRQSGIVEEMAGDVGRAADATRDILVRARDTEPPTPPPSRVVPYDETDEISISPVQLEILGEVSVKEDRFPLTSDLYRHFRRGGDSRFVRLDTEESYRDFRAAQSPVIAELRDKVARLERMLQAHMQDGHGAQDTIVGLASDVSKLQAEEQRARVAPLMPPWAKGTWDCWRQEGPRGGLICCSVSVPGPDGSPRICTSATPLEEHVHDVVGCAFDAGHDVSGLLGVLPTIACMLGGGRLLRDVCAATPAVLDHPAAKTGKPFVGRIVVANHPTRAALIALLQYAQTGNERARREWEELAQLAERSPSLRQSMEEARARLVEAQSAQVLGDSWSRR